MHAPGAQARAGAARETLALERSRPFEWLVRAGFLARGLTYGLIGALTVALAAGAGSASTSPDQQGALALIARAPLGRLAVGFISAGLLAYAIWKLSQAVIGRGPEGGGGPDLKDRIANFGGGVAYVAFFAVAVRVLAGSGGDSSAQSKQAAAGALGWPGGQAVVGIAGGGLLAISLYQVYDAVRGSFQDDIKLHEMGARERRLFLVLGHVGLVARAVVFGLVGYFLLRTAIDANASRAVGVDGALARVHAQPFGAWLLGLTAAGLLTFAAFTLLEARHRRL